MINILRFLSVSKQLFPPIISNTKWLVRQVIVSIQDFNVFVNSSAKSNQYLAADCKVDGSVTITGFNFYQKNAITIGIQPIRY